MRWFPWLFNKLICASWHQGISQMYHNIRIFASWQTSKRKTLRDYWRPYWTSQDSLWPWRWSSRSFWIVRLNAIKIAKSIPQRLFQLRILVALPIASSMMPSISLVESDFDFIILQQCDPHEVAFSDNTCCSNSSLLHCREENRNLGEPFYLVFSLSMEQNEVLWGT